MSPGSKSTQSPREVRCHNCNYLTPRNSRFCSHCGHDFGRATFENPPDPAKVRKELERDGKEADCEEYMRNSKFDEPTGEICGNCGRPRLVPGQRLAIPEDVDHCWSKTDEDCVAREEREKLRRPVLHVNSYAGKVTADPDIDAIFGRTAPTKYNVKELFEVLIRIGGEPTWTSYDGTSDNGGAFTTAKWTNPTDEMLLAAWNSGLHVLAQSLTTGDKELIVFVSMKLALEVE